MPVRVLSRSKLLFEEETKHFCTPKIPLVTCILLCSNHLSNSHIAELVPSMRQENIVLKSEMKYCNCSREGTNVTFREKDCIIMWHIGMDECVDFSK